MPVTTTLGVVFLPFLPPEQLREAVLAAEAAALEELWLWEDCFRESGIAAAAAALAWTTRLRVGIGVLPVPLRNVALTAMELATLARMFPDRLLAGMGHGVQDWMQQVGERVASPLTLLREQTTALRALLEGETLQTAGRYVHLDDVALDWPPAFPPPLLLGAVGPKTLSLSGELADGTILTGGTAPEQVAAARETIDAARREAAVSRRHTVTVYLLAATGPDVGDRLARELTEWGMGPDSGIGVAGNAAAIAAAAQRYVLAGADTIVFQPTRDEPDLAGFMGVIARDVRALMP